MKAICRVAVAGLAMIPLPGIPIARWISGDARDDLKSDAAVPDGYKKAIVRVGKPLGKLGKKFFGPISSGVVIRVKIADDGKSADVWVLTADHVTQPAKDRAFLGVFIGFGNAEREFPQFEAQQIIRGKDIKAPVRGKPIDLAILKVNIADIKDLPRDMKVPEIHEVDKDKQLFVAGYGRTAKAFVEDTTELKEWYQIDNSIPIGTLRIGLDMLNDRPKDFKIDKDADHPIEYLFDALEGSLAFQRGIRKENKERGFVAGDAYVLGGDSGGPTLQEFCEVCGTWQLVGIHSISNKEDSDKRVYPGYRWWDVDVFKYKAEIELKAGITPRPTMGVWLERVVADWKR